MWAKVKRLTGGPKVGMSVFHDQFPVTLGIEQQIRSPNLGSFGDGKKTTPWDDIRSANLM